MMTGGAAPDVLPDAVEGGACLASGVSDALGVGLAVLVADAGADATEAGNQDVA